MTLAEFGRRLNRKKHIPKGDLTTKLKRCLNTFDVTMIGIGHMVGAGIYVTTGEVMRNLAGPSTVISYIVAGISALLSALCYAELGSRLAKNIMRGTIPRGTLKEEIKLAGSAYTYAYVGCGEIWAFIIGWNIVLEHVLSSAAVARTFAGYVDHEAGGAITGWVKTSFPWFPVTVANTTGEVFQICNDSDTGMPDKSLISPYPDVVALVSVLICALFVGVGSKAAAHFNSIFSVANLLVIVAVVGYGATFINFSYWSDFAPCGAQGILAGASKCFFAYVGFDGLATAGEEAKNPSTTIPRATYYSMAMTSISYVLMAAVLSLMVPYSAINTDSVYASAFITAGAPYWFSHVIAVGALLGILTSLIGSLFSLPRAVFAMAEDGLIFGWWANVNPYTKTPLNATITFTILAGIISVLFDLDALVDFLSVGTILAYSMVAAALLMLRYSPHPHPYNPEIMDNGGRFRSSIPFVSGVMAGNKPHTVIIGILVMSAGFVGVGLIFKNSWYNHWIGLTLMIICFVISIFALLFIHGHKQNNMELDYKVGMVPYLPAASLFINIIMMTQLTMMTWIRLIVWMSIGLAIYLLYGIRHSKEELAERQLKNRLGGDAPKQAWGSDSDVTSHTSSGKDYEDSETDVGAAKEATSPRLDITDRARF